MLVIDLVHVLLWAAAWCFHARDDPAAEDWVAVQALAVLAGRARQVTSSLTAQAAQHGLAESQQALVAVMADRTDWEEATRQQRQLAIAADAELCRRHPGQHHPPLRSAGSQPGTRDQRDEPVLNAHDDIEPTKELIAEFTAQRRELAKH